jgi:hypothetical protein
LALKDKEVAIMNPLDEQIEAVAAMLRTQGGVVGIDPNAPDYVKRAWLEMILGCRECRKGMMGGHNGHGN